MKLLEYMVILNRLGNIVRLIIQPPESVILVSVACEGNK